MAEREINDDTQHELCDSLVDIYTSALTSWLAAHTGNLQLCTAAVIEGLVSSDEDIEPRIKSAQYMALTYIYGALVSAIEAHAEEQDSETSETEVRS
jgi:hypothetical protein